MLLRTPRNSINHFFTFETDGFHRIYQTYPLKFSTKDEARLAQTILFFHVHQDSRNDCQFTNQMWQFIQHFTAVNWEVGIDRSSLAFQSKRLKIQSVMNPLTPTRFCVWDEAFTYVYTTLWFSDTQPLRQVGIPIFLYSDTANLRSNGISIIYGTTSLR